ncbi:MAG TPA: hypothetical protein VLZ10_06280, partial [Thermodesulfobacteriota bacterium]|nr:hypothetical protein [Thermodesulfobacteriota bacterium]
SIRADEVEDMPLRNSNPVKGCIIVLQIEHIDLEFNINVFPFSPSRNPRGAVRRQAATRGGWKEGGVYH